MTTWQTALAHVLIAFAAIGASCALAIEGLISGAYAYAVISAVLVGTGVIAGSNLTTTTTTATPPPAGPV
jgi:hypothetical protein